MAAGCYEIIGLGANRVSVPHTILFLSPATLESGPVRFWSAHAPPARSGLHSTGPGRCGNLEASDDDQLAVRSCRWRRCPCCVYPAMTHLFPVFG
jgi:hypothetical protein